MNKMKYIYCIMFLVDLGNKPKKTSYFQEFLAVFRPKTG